ncbi:MAG: hypothetical protein GXO01_01435 [Epsilonproteobacteria bacterium]|nr:hypothetical protein [Campylobacterota bacterium]
MYNAGELEKLLDKDGIVFLTYGGTFTQSLIVAMTEALEKEAQKSLLSKKLSHNIFIVFIELSQNLMNYSKKVSHEFDPKGLILVGKNENDGYFVYSQNIVKKEDAQKLEKILKKIIDMPKEELKKIYREERRKKRDPSHNGGGIGFYEIAKKAEKIEYSLEPIGDDKYMFKLKVVLGKE